MKKLKRDLTKPEKIEVKKKVVKHQDEYQDGPEFEWADEWFEGEAETEVKKTPKKDSIPSEKVLTGNAIKKLKLKK